MPPGGPYAGIYSGYIVTIPLNDGYYQLTTKDGIRGSGPCSVMVDKDGNISFAESP